MDDLVVDAVTSAFGDDLPMVLYRQSPSSGVRMYVGLWATWTVGGEAPAAKVVFATVPADESGDTTTTTTTTTLGKLPWRILQFQTIRQTDKVADPEGRGTVWEAIHQLLHKEFAQLEGQDTTGDECKQRVFFHGEAQIHSMRRMRDRDWLNACTIEREDDAAQRPEVAPTETIGRAVVPYRATFMPVTLPPVAHATLPEVWVHVERSVPRRTILGQAVQREKGFVRESTLLAAIEEWRTWLIIGDA